MSGRIGEMAFGDPPNSFGALNIVDQMEIVSSLENSRARRLELEQKAAESLVSNTVEIQGEHNE